MFVEGDDYRVIRPEEAYVLLRRYEHSWVHNPPRFKDQAPSEASLGYASFSDAGMVLEPEYRWNGSNVVVDSSACMRASAVHDAWCQAMGRGILEHSEENWDRGVEEYVAICDEDGLGEFAQRIRERFMLLWGELRFPGEHGLWRIQGGRGGRRLRSSAGKT